MEGGYSKSDAIYRIADDLEWLQIWET